MSIIKTKIITAIRSKCTAREGVANCRYFKAITVDQKLTTFTTGANIDTLKHVVPDAFLVFSGFDMASRGDQTFVAITYARCK